MQRSVTTNPFRLSDDQRLLPVPVRGRSLLPPLTMVPGAPACLERGRPRHSRGIGPAAVLPIMAFVRKLQSMAVRVIEVDARGVPRPTAHLDSLLFQACFDGGFSVFFYLLPTERSNPVVVV